MARSRCHGTLYDILKIVKEIGGVIEFSAYLEGLSLAWTVVGLNRDLGEVI